jgi:hypothetical protein
VKEFLEEITETLLRKAPTITAEQLLQMRQELVQVALRHGWVDSDLPADQRPGMSAAAPGASVNGA